MLKKIGTALVLAYLLPGAVLAEDQITIHKTVVDTLRYAPRLEMIKHNREAVEHDLRKSRGLWYPRIDVRGGIGTDAHSSRQVRAGAEPDHNRTNQQYDEAGGEDLEDGAARDQRC